MASPKTRDYFITINQNAECYEEALDIVNELNTICYAHIIHDRDYIVQDTGQLQMKATHKHIVVELKNPITFQSMQKKFMGAHIEPIRYKKASYQYLLHESPNSKEKYHYEFTDIISNRPELVKLALETEEGIEIFKEYLFMDYILDGIRTAYSFAKRFGLNAYKQYWKSYKEIIEQLDTDQEMQRDLEILKLEREANEPPF